MTTLRKALAALTLLAVTAPVMAQDRTAAEQEVIRDVEQFFAAQNAADKGAMKQAMVRDAILTVTRTGSVSGPRSEVLSTRRYIKRVMTYKGRAFERMSYAKVEVTGDTALVEGPFVFTVDGAVTHCGINSLAMVKSDGRWRVGDSRYDIVPPSDCDKVGAPSAAG
jgi:ketosteroid isomerase-like protein